VVDAGGGGSGGGLSFRKAEGQQTGV
jgi:hypothetical protein